MENIELTVHLLNEKFGGSVNGGIQFAKRFEPEYPERPKKPTLSRIYSSVEAKQHAKDMEEYEKLQGEYNIQMDVYQAGYKRVNSIVEQFIKEQSGLLAIVPVQYQEKVYRKAYEEGHSNGFSEIYNQLLGLIEIFE